MPITAKSTVNEGQTAYITLSFTDETGNAVNVSSLYYTLNDNNTNNEITSGNVTGVNNNSYTFELTPVMNVIINNNADYEEHVLTIDASYSTNRHVTGAYKFDVVNLRFLNS